MSTWHYMNQEVSSDNLTMWWKNNLKLFNTGKNQAYTTRLDKK